MWQNAFQDWKYELFDILNTRNEWTRSTMPFLKYRTLTSTVSITLTRSLLNKRLFSVETRDVLLHEAKAQTWHKSKTQVAGKHVTAECASSTVWTDKLLAVKRLWISNFRFGLEAWDQKEKISRIHKYLERIIEPETGMEEILNAVFNREVNLLGRLKG